MAWVVLPPERQTPGALMGGIWVAIQAWPVQNHFTVAQLGPEGARVTESGGSWEVAPVPRQVGITEYKGRRNYRMTLDLLYDGWVTHVIRPSLQGRFTPGLPNFPKGAGITWNTNQVPRGVWIEGMLKELESLTIPQDRDTAPRSVRLYGAVPHTEVRWVIDGIDWGDCIRDIQTGRRMRQQVTLSLLEYNQPGDLAKLPRSKRIGF